MKVRMLILYLILPSTILLFTQHEEDDYISIRGPSSATHKKEVKNQKKAEKIESKENVLVEVNEEGKECVEYKVVDAFQCKDCLSFVLKEHKKIHNPDHKLKEVKIGIRYKCSKCGKIFVGDFSTFCPKCKERLKNEIIEVEEVKEETQTYLVDKKTNKKICNIDVDKKEESKNEK